ncbi:MAG TPA: serine/threonine-protein kinase [Polyangia bacterium]|nr:serine/threonine-protein kinase [Polyangia bacterium]
MTADAGARVGELVGAKYRIVRLLAQGGMGVVYEAQHTVVKRRFAVKFLRRELTERRDILTRFHHEAEAAGALESEHVAAAVDFGIADDGAPYIVMEYLVGESLTALCGREGPLPVGRAADLVGQAARGVAVAHAAGIIHRDLKPQNLFLCRRQDGTDLLKVLDFGVAKLQALDDPNAATRTGAVVGTVAYMSPEQARGDKIVDERSDVYALGAILYELCSGKKPHPGESPNAILHHIATQPPAPLAALVPDLPPAFVAVVEGALAADPSARPASAEALAAALAPFATRVAWPAPKLEDSGAPRVAPPPAARSASAPSRSPRAPSRLLPVAAAVAGLGVALAVLAGLSHRRPDPTPPLPAPPAVAVAPAPVAAPVPVPAAASPAPPAVAAVPAAARAATPRRRHPETSRPAPELPPAAALTPPSPAPPARPAATPAVTFDQKNPYE